MKSQAIARCFLFQLCLLPLSMLPFSLVAQNAEFQDHKPWLGTLYEFEAKALYEYSKAHHVKTLHGIKHYKSHAQMAALKLGFMPSEKLQVSLQCSGYETQKKDFSYDSTALTLSYSLLEDLVADPCSLAIGATCSLVQRPFLKDISVMHHGNFESLFFGSLGKEYQLKEGYYLRAWAFAGLGVANKGSSWTEEEVHLSLFKESEAVKQDTSSLDVFVALKQGLGHNKLFSPHHFEGYKNLGFRLIDVGLNYTYHYQSLGSIYLGVKKRISARFCPSDLYAVEAGVTIPFSF